MGTTSQASIFYDGLSDDREFDDQPIEPKEPKGKSKGSKEVKSKETPSKFPKTVKSDFKRAIKLAGVVAALSSGALFAKGGWDQQWEEQFYGDPAQEMAEKAGVEGLSTCTINSPQNGIEVMIGATINPETGDATAFTYARPGSDDGENVAKAAFSINTVQERTQGEEVITEEINGDVIGINQNKKVQGTDIYARNGAQIKEVTLNAQLVTPQDNGRAIVDTCSTAVAVDRGVDR